MTINPNKYYKTGKIAVSDPLIEASGYNWLLRQIKSGRLPAENTSGNDEIPRYKVKGTDLIKFIEELHKKK